MTRTEVEAFLSHTHVIDLVQHKMPWKDGQYDHLSPDFESLCKVGKRLAAMWYQKLRADFPDYRFRVYYTQDDDPIVRFHRVRKDEPYWLNEKDYRAEIEQGKVIIYDTEQRLLTTTARNRKRRVKNLRYGLHLTLIE